MKRQVQHLGLWRRYTSEDDFSHAARMIPALAFLPRERLKRALEDLRQALPEALEPVLDYFEDTYFGRLRVHNGVVSRRNPLFPVEMWTVYQRTLDGEARTNNFAEASHRRLQGEFAVDHPSLFDFIKGLQHAQHNRDAQLERFIAGTWETQRGTNTS